MTSPVDLLRLAPGLRVVRRGRDRLQVGLHEERRVVLPRTPEVERLLALLVRPHDDPTETPEPTTADESALAALARHDCLVEVGRRRPRGLAVAVAGSLPGLDTAPLLRGAGLRVARTTTRPDVVLHLTAGETDRSALDHLVRRRTPHLLVRLVDGAALLGPFVAPGRTACLRCVDAHLGVADPEHVVVTTRYQRALAQPRLDAPDVAVGPSLALAQLALAWAARDLAAYAEEREPATWSRTLRLGPAPTEIGRREWQRHPLCGCAWSADDRDCGTMGA